MASQQVGFALQLEARLPLTAQQRLAVNPPEKPLCQGGLRQVRTLRLTPLGPPFGLTGAFFALFRHPSCYRALFHSRVREPTYGFRAPENLYGRLYYGRYVPLNNKLEGLDTTQEHKPRLKPKGEP